MKSKNLGPLIIELRSQGKIYQEICDLLNCSLATVCFHCGKNQKEKSRERRKQTYHNVHPYKNKIKNFFKHYQIGPSNENSKEKLRVIFRSKIRTFLENRDMSRERTIEKPNFTVEDVLAKFGNEPRCYLTGDLIDINKSRSYHFDHIIPYVQGGSNDLDNLGLCTKEANMSKAGLTLEQYLNLCKKVLEHNNYIVTKK